MDQLRFRELLAGVDSVSLRIRLRPLDGPVRTLYRRILTHFAGQGGAPTAQTLQTWAAELEVGVDEALAELVRVDLIQADPATQRVTSAYPFSDQPRGHRVEVEGGPTVQACCAADALGVAAMLHRPVTISSRDPQSGTEIRVEVRDGRPAWEPSEALVTIPVDEACAGGQAGDCQCPAVNFCASAASAEAYQRAHGLALEMLTVPQAHELGSAVFGGLLDPEPG
ncbi:MAG: organomercurial lyase [Candidatus Dormibacteraceae bacterium]